MTIVVKIGGARAVDPGNAVGDIASLVAGEPGQGHDPESGAGAHDVVVAHGGSTKVDETLERLGMEPEYVETPDGVSGRFTDEATMEVFEMALPGVLNTELVAQLRSAGVDAIGLSGVDGGILEGPRKTAVRVLEDGTKKIRRGDHSGSLKSVDADLLETLLDAGRTPVVSPPMAGHEDDGTITPVNVDADRTAAAIAAALDATLVYLTDVPGVLTDPEDRDSLIREADTPAEWDELQAAAEGGMGRKLMAAREALEGGAPEVIVADASLEAPVYTAMEGDGTHVYPGALEGSESGGVGVSGFVFSEKPIELVEGDGPHLYDADGAEYLDFGASYACVPLGHGHPAVRSAVRDQLDRLTFVQASYPVQARTTLYETLAAVAPGDLGKVWLCNSGTEANEAALKFARSATGNSKLVATMQGFHGRTMGSLATTWKDQYKAPYEPLIGDVEFVSYDDADALREAVDDETAGVIMEPIQGEGGINPASDEYLQAAREVTTEANAALIFDEVQTGLGRTGEFWAGEAAGVVPDVLTTAKGLGNGFPVGATLCRDWIAENHGSHASTFSGGPVIAAAANATLSTIRDEDLPQHAAAVGEYLRAELEAALGEDVREVRGEGLMVGIEVKRGANRLLKELALSNGVLALPAGRTVLRLLPPLTIEESHADAVVEALAEVVG